MWGERFAGETPGVLVGAFCESVVAIVETVVIHPGAGVHDGHVAFMG